MAANMCWDWAWCLFLAADVHDELLNCQPMFLSMMPWYNMVLVIPFIHATTSIVIFVPLYKYIYFISSLFFCFLCTLKFVYVFYYFPILSLSKYLVCHTVYGGQHVLRLGLMPTWLLLEKLGSMPLFSCWCVYGDVLKCQPVFLSIMPWYTTMVGHPFHTCY